MRPQSLLTRQIFRAIIANKPYRIPGCQLRPLHQTRRSPARAFHSSRIRPLFGLTLGDAPQPLTGSKPTPQNVERALGQLVEVVRARRMQHKPPDDTGLVDALRFLFSARADSPKDLTRTEVFLITETLDHLQSRGVLLDDEVPVSLTKEDLQNLLAALAAHGGGDTLRSDARLLADFIFKTFRQTAISLPEGATSSGSEVDPDIFGPYLRVLTRTGYTHEALALLRGATELPRLHATSLWIAVLKGLYSEKGFTDFWKVLDETQKRLGPLDPQSHEELTSFVAGKEDLESTRRLLGLKLRDGSLTNTKCLSNVLALCIRTGDNMLGKECAKIVECRPDLDLSSAVLVSWFASQNPDSRALRSKMIELTDRGAPEAISMATFNYLIRQAYASNSPEQVERYINLAESFGLRPDGSTYAMQLNYDLARDAMTSAVEAFDALLTEDVPEDRSDVVALNHLLRRLAFSNDPSHELIMRAVDRVLDTGADLEADTVAGLCSVFLRNDELDQVAGLVRYRVDAFPKTQRARIVVVFKAFVMDPSVKDEKAWNVYDLLRHAFPEMEVPDRISLMQNFFDRKRSDLACLVFGHMRQRKEVEARPTAEAYTQCFFGIAQCRDVDGLLMVNNMLKMDQEVERTTKVRNSLVAAYTACREPFTAIIDHFWKVLDSREGPTLSTFLLAFRACETWIPQGSLEARRIMALMQKWDMIITKEIYEAYLGAIAGQSEFENAIELIEHMEDDIGESPDATTLGVFYNSIPWQYRKDEVGAWAEKAYPELWAELKSLPEVVDEEWDIRYYQIDRHIDTDDRLLFEEGQYSPQLAQQTRFALEEPAT